MPETWLKPNLRALLPAALVVSVVFVAGSAILAVAAMHGGGLWLGLGAILALAGLLGALALWQWARQPRLAYEQGELLVYLGRGGPWRMPVEVVECFFLGQYPTTPDKSGGEAPAAAVVVRLAEREIDYHEREVLPSLGRWCDGYITVRGTWCEPLTLDRVEQLNRRLAEIHRQRKEAQGESGP